MSFRAFALLTSDPNLLRCELVQLGDRVSLGGSADPAEGERTGWRASMAAYGQEGILLNDFPSHDLPVRAGQLLPDPESSVVLLTAQPARLGVDGTPLRHGPWLFSVAGKLPADPRWRETLGQSLSSSLQETLASLGGPETLFGAFLQNLRRSGSADDVRLSAHDVAQSLARATREARDAMNHHSGEPEAVLLATNGHVLTAARLGSGPLFFRLQEGLMDCPVHALREARESDPRVQQHRRVRTVVVASHPAESSGWTALGPGHALGADERGGLERV